MWSRARGLTTGLLALGGAALLLDHLGEVYEIRQWLFWPIALLWLYNIALFLSFFSAGHLVLTRLLRLRLSRLDTLAFSIPVGAVVFCLLMFLLGALGLFRTSAAIVLVVALVMVDAGPLYRFLRDAVSSWRKPAGTRSLVTWVAVPFGVICLALVYFPLITPEALNFDSTWYHLTVAQDYAREGRIIPFYGDYMRNMPQLTPLIHTWGWLLPMPSLTQRWTMPLHTEFFVLLSTLVGVAAMIGYLIEPRRVRFAWVGFFLFPSVFVYDKSIGGSADHFVALFCPTLYLAAARARDRLAPGYLALFGILAAGAILGKYQAVYFIGPCCVLLAVGWFARLRGWARRQPDDEPRWSDRRAVLWGPLLVIGVVLLVTAPHFGKNWLYYGNPLYPFAQDLLGGHPTVENAAYQVDYFMVDDAFRPRGSLGERLLESLEVLLTFSVQPFYSFTKKWPDFGSVFTLSLPLLLLVRRPGRMLAASGIGCLAVFVWAMTYRVDRNLQSVVPMLAAATAATLICAWDLGRWARFGATVLVAVQVIWSGDVMFYSQNVNSQKGRIDGAVKMVTSGFRGTLDERDDYRQSFRRLGEMLPPDARLLIRPMPVALGIDRNTVLDQPGHQGLITYAGIRGPTSLRDYYQRLGITHVAWGESSPSWTRRSEILVRELMRSMPVQRVGGFAVGEVARAKPRPDPEEYLVYLHGIPGFGSGLFRLDDLGTYEPVAAHLKQYAPPLERLPDRTDQRLRLLDRAAAALVGKSRSLTHEEREELGRGFTSVHRYSSFEVFLRR